MKRRNVVCLIVVVAAKNVGQMHKEASRIAQR